MFKTTAFEDLYELANRVIGENKKIKLEIDQLRAALEVKQKRIEELEADDKTTMKHYSEMTAEAKRKDDRISELEADIQKKISIHHIVCETNYQRGFEAGKIEGEKLTARTTDEEKDRIFDQGYAKAKLEQKNEPAYFRGYKDGIEWFNGVLNKHMGGK